jgi:hypothetical protein
MKKDVQEAFEKALAVFEKRQEAEHQRFREREKFETEWTRIRTVVVVPALEEIKALLSKAGWQCEVRADKDQGQILCQRPLSAIMRVVVKAKTIACIGNAARSSVASSGWGGSANFECRQAAHAKHGWRLLPAPSSRIPTQVQHRRLA